MSEQRVKRRRSGKDSKLTLMVPHYTLLLLQKGAEYHQVSVKEYATWLVELGSNREAKIYDWTVDRPEPEFEVKLNNDDLLKIEKLAKKSTKKLRKLKAGA